MTKRHRRSRALHVDLYVDGGLGSQMCKVAVGKILEHKTRCQIRFDIREYDLYEQHNGFEVQSVFPTLSLTTFKRVHPIINPKQLRQVTGNRALLGVARLVNKAVWEAERVLRHTRVETVADPFDLNTVTSIVSLRTHSYFYAHWFNLSDFLEDEEQLAKALFVFDETLVNHMTKQLLAELNSKSDEYVFVSLHVRRGDYHSAGEHSTWADIAKEGFYERAISLIQSSVERPFLVVFSDDPPWVTANLQLPPDNIVVDWNTGKDSWQDMLLMSHCEHNIVANSSFSMWGAILNQNPNKIVVAPNMIMRAHDLDRFFFRSWRKV